VIELVKLAGIEIAAALAVAEKGIILPAVPEAADDMHEFARALIAFGDIVVLITVEVEACRRISRRHDIPAGAAAADMIEGAEQPSDVEGFIIAC
jgi:hypothetical protein